MAHTRQPCLPCSSYGSALTCSWRAAPLRASTVGRTTSRPWKLVQHNFLGVVDQHKRRPGSLTDNVYRIQTAAGDGHSAPEAINAPDEDTSAASEPAASPAKTRVQKAKELANRVVFGLLLGVGGAVVISYGKLVLLALCLFVTYQASVEYVGIMTSKQMSAGIPPPNRLVSAATTVMCVGIALFNHFVAGRSGTVLAVAGFLLLVLQVVANKRPKFSQLASSLFGLFYCGWLPSFWLKLRAVSTPAPDTQLAALLGAVTTPTVGLVAVLTGVAAIIAADTGAYFVGRSLGRTKLTDISPKKTVEGAAGGMAAAVAVTLASWRLFAWPATPVAALVLGVLVFFSSLFGDLIESIMKRDAGMKDSGDLIPGHGGLLDRFDSYIFSGAVVYFYTLFLLPLLTGQGNPLLAGITLAA